MNGGLREDVMMDHVLSVLDIKKRPLAGSERPCFPLWNWLYELDN